MIVSVRGGGVGEGEGGRGGEGVGESEGGGRSERGEKSEVEWECEQIKVMPTSCQWPEQAHGTPVFSCEYSELEA